MERREGVWRGEEWKCELGRELDEWMEEEKSRERRGDVTPLADGSIN
jgi:hypothetical protein